MEPLDATKQESERLEQHNTELESECRLLQAALAAAEENVAAPASVPVEPIAAVVPAPDLSRPTYPSVLVFGGAPTLAPDEPNVRDAAVSLTATVVSMPALSLPGELDPGPVQSPKLPLSVTTLNSGRARAFVKFNKKL
jgi:hypothetical protein